MATQTLESLKILFEAGTKKCLVSFLYPDKNDTKHRLRVRTVEPYGLRYPKTGSILLFCWDVDADGLRSFKLESMVEITMEEEAFEPRFVVELDMTA